MQNKKGSIVCLEPATGEILAMVSSPSYDPALLTIHRGRTEAYNRLNQDTVLTPFFNRATMAIYPPGSIFKPILALIAMQEGVLSPQRTIYCDGAYHYRHFSYGCHSHSIPYGVDIALQHSCNSYFFQVFRDIVEKQGFNNPEAGLAKLNDYLMDFGLNQKLGVDIPSENSGNIPDGAYYDQLYGKGTWRSTYMLSLGIGQGELQFTSLQMANLAAIIANRGHYYTPHLLKEFIGSEDNSVHPEKNIVHIENDYFEPVVEGMERAVRAGTAVNAYHPEISICGKTGTSQNPQGKDHSVFFAFAPKENPRIAISVYVENGGWGATYAAPIASLMIERYLTRETRSSRKWIESRILESDLITVP
jgi:penicillin-binding protein 2